MMKKIICSILLMFIGMSLSASPLTLDSCLQLARKNNRALQSAALAVDKAHEVKREVLTKYFPQVSGFAMGYYSLHPLIEVGINDVPNASARDILNLLYHNYGASLGLPSSLGFLQYGYAAGVSALQPVYVGGKIVNGNRLADVGIEAAELQQEIAERDLLETVEESFWLVVGLSDKQVTLRSTTHLLDTIHHTVAAAVDAGIALRSDLLQVEMKQDEIARTQVQLSNGIELATRALCQSIGIDYSDSISLRGDSISLSDSLLPANSSSKTLPESDLLALQTKAAQLQYKMALADALPQIAVGAAYGYGKLQASGIRNNLGNASGNGALMVTVSIPVSEWWETGHRLKEKKLSMQQAQLDEKDKNELLSLRTQQIYNQLVEAVWFIQETGKARQKAEENYRLAQLNYQSGLITVADLLTAQTMLYKAKNDYTDALITYRIRLHRYNDLKVCSINSFLQ